MTHADLVIVAGQPRVVSDALFAAHGLQAWYVRAAAHADGTVAVVAQTAPGDGCTVVSGSRRWSPGGEVAYGVQCVGIVAHPAGWQVTWVRAGGTHYGRIVLDRDLRPTTPTFANRPVPDAVRGTTQGFLDVELDGEPRWTDLHRTVTLGGHRLFLPMRRGDWTLGQDADVDRLLIHQHSTGQTFVAFDGYTPVASRLAVDEAGEPWVLPAGSTTVVGIDQLAPWTPAYAPVVSIGRPLWMGFFEFAHVNPGALPSNCRAPVTQGARYLDVQGPGWAYVSGDPDGDLSAIERAITDVSGLAPVVAYVPRRAQHGLPTSAELQGVECYIGADETDAQFVARIEAALRKSPRAVLIAQCYSSNHTLTADLRRVPGLVSRLARDHRNVEGILVFSGSGRATGWQDHPEVHAAWRQVFAGITGTPALDPPRPPAPTKPEPKPEPPPASPDLADRLRRFQTMYRGESLRSPDGRTVLTFQHDGNLVLTRDGIWRWHSGTHGLDAGVLEMQGDGHLVLSDEDGAAIWGSGTHGHLGAELRVLDDGTAVIVSPTGEILWQAPRAEPTPAPEPAPTPDPSPEPERHVSRKPNVKKALLDFFRGLAAVFGIGPKPQRRPPMAGPPSNDPAIPESSPQSPIQAPPPPRQVSIDEMRALVLSGTLPPPLPRNPEPFVHAVLQAVDDPRWGLHRRPNGHIGGGVIAFAEPAHGKPHQIFDIVAGGMTDHPRPNWLDQTHTMEDGSTFMPFPRAARPPSVPTQTLPRIYVSGTQFLLEGGARFQWRGVTAFDLPRRIAEGDTRYLDWIAEQGFTIARIVVASVHRTRRTLEQGLAELPACLDALAARDMYAEVVCLVDTRDYGMDVHQGRWYVSEVANICRARTNTVLEIANEIGHGTQQPWLSDADTLAELVGRCHGIATSAGSTHGGQEPHWTQGSYVTHHADRSKSPAVNGQIMAEYQRRIGKPIVDDEALGISAAIRPGSRTNDPSFGAQQAEAYRRYQLGGVTLHLEAGLHATVDHLDSIQREAARQFIAAMKGH